MEARVLAAEASSIEEVETSDNLPFTRQIGAYQLLTPLSPLYPLAHLRLARAVALMGDMSRSRKAYEDFFGVWKEADADLPVLREAKRESGKR